MSHQSTPAFVSAALPLETLVSLACEGDQSAWNAIVDRYAGLVWAVCARFRLSHTDAADVSQTVWLRTVENTQDPMHDFATRIVAARKVVFTRTLTESPWPNTELANGNLKEEVLKLKAQAPVDGKSQTGKDILVYGGSSFVAALISSGLIDEFHFFVNPIVLGRGASAFSQLETWQPLALKNAVPLASGLVLLHYERR